MAAVSAAILCDFAQVREGLLFVNSGGITRAFAEQLPAPLNMMLGLIVERGPAEAEAAHELVVTVKHVESAGVLAGWSEAAGPGRREVPGEVSTSPSPSTSEPSR